MTQANKRMVAVVGPTASGKTSMAIKLALEFNGEIVCVDSRTVYRGLDIGTAKPTKAQRETVRHHLLDILDPGDTITAANFKRMAQEAIDDIAARGKVPFLVGGSGLYMDAVLYNYQFPGEADKKNRAELQELSIQALKNKLKSLDPTLYSQVDVYNKRRLIRAIETVGHERSKNRAVIDGCLCLGLTMSNEVARERIRLRLAQMVADGLLDEVEVIGDKYGFDCPALDVTGYGSFKQVVFGETTPEDGMLGAENETMAVYKKQVTWFKRNKEIHWVKDFAEAKELVSEFARANV